MTQEQKAWSEFITMKANRLIDTQIGRVVDLLEDKDVSMSTIQEVILILEDFADMIHDQLL